jgi:transglutaminase-like putative cysteine protease
MVKWARPLVVAAALAGMISLAGVVLGSIYADSLLVRLVAGAAAGSVGLGVAARRLPNWTVAPLSAVLLAAYTIFCLWLTAGRADVAGPLPQIARDSLVNGIPRLLTAMIPVDPAPDTVVVPVIAAWVAGLAGAEVAVRARRVLFGQAPAVALYAGALYVVGPNASTAGWATLAFAGLAIAALATRPADTEISEVSGRVRGRGIAGAAAGLAAVLTLGAAIGPWVGGQVDTTPVDPRRYVQPPQVDSLDESPLNRISGWALSPRQRLLEVSPPECAGSTNSDLSGKAGGCASVTGGKTERLRLAVLPDYDGITWRVGATYRNAGRVLPEQPKLPDTTTTEVRQEITLGELTGRLLPVLPTPTEITGARVAFDAATGTVIRPEQLAAGVRYDVVSQVQTPDLNLLPNADVPAGDAVARFLAVGPGVPEQIQRLADPLAEGTGAAFDRATAIQDFLAEHYRKVADAPSGHAYPNLTFFLLGSRDQGGQRGTSEQFAASFALLARLTGLPSRVVVGFDAPAAGGTVTAGDAIAWPEVLFDGLGWVAFDPMPKSRNPRPVEEDFTPKPTKPPTPPSEPPTSADLSSSSAPPAAVAAAGGGGPGTVIVAGGASGSVLIVLLVVAFTLVTMRRSLRRRRLTVGTPDDRIAGAWAELSDALRLAGRPMPSHLAATEAAAYAKEPAPVRKTRLRRAAPGSASASGRSRRAAPGPASTFGRSPRAAPELAPASGRSPRVVPEPATASGRSPSAPAAGRAADDMADPVAETEPLPPLDELVAGINAVGFAPGAADESQADRAGRQVVAYGTALRARRSWWRRMWWSVRPGPLRWRGQ